MQEFIAERSICDLHNFALRRYIYDLIIVSTTGEDGYIEP